MKLKLLRRVIDVVHSAAFGRLCVETIPLSKRSFVITTAAFGRLCVETITRKKPNNFLRPAAFGRLCVETRLPDILVLRRRQPPSGGCVLKHIALFPFVIPPSQPPSGGCVLKHWQGWRISEIARPAAFGRLCVETALNLSNSARRASAAFGRLCVETV